MPEERLPSGGSRAADPVPLLRGLPDHWAPVLAYGVLTVCLGVVLAAWPEQTLVVCAVLVGVQLLLSGLYRVLMALTARSLDGGVRALLGLSGALALIVGLLCLREPLQSVLVIGILLGGWLLVSGVVDVLGAVLSGEPGRRGWDIASGLVGVVVGGFLLANPEVSVGLLVVLACTWFFAIGGLAVIMGLRLRSQSRATAPRPAAAGLDHP